MLTKFKKFIYLSKRGPLKVEWDEKVLGLAANAGVLLGAT